MSIFKKNEPQPQKPRDRPTPTGRGSSTDGAISIIGSGMNVVGDISTEGIVRIEGQVRGTIRAGKGVVLGQAGVIEGNVYTDDAVIGGTVSGSIVAAVRLELQSTCTVEGEIRTRAEHLKLEEGARFAGQVHMIEEEALAASSPSTSLEGSSPPSSGPRSPGRPGESGELTGGIVSFGEEADDAEAEETDAEASDEDAQNRRKKAEAHG